jgi:hypothetical protein
MSQFNYFLSFNRSNQPMTTAVKSYDVADLKLADKGRFRMRGRPKKCLSSI